MLCATSTPLSPSNAPWASKMAPERSVCNESGWTDMDKSKRKRSVTLKTFAAFGFFLDSIFRQEISKLINNVLMIKTKIMLMRRVLSFLLESKERFQEINKEKRKNEEEEEE